MDTFGYSAEEVTAYNKNLENDSEALMKLYTF